jgi:hypothetical protein
MRKTDIEYWAINVIERVENQQSVEDARVELKSDWIDPIKAARRIAGHANAAHAEPILWLFGVDEKEGAKGIENIDLARWFDQIKSQFDGISPESTSIIVPWKNISILAIIFETDRAPYVIKNPAGGSIQYEVPWRDSTSVRSANRSELLTILVPLQRIPLIEIITGKLIARKQTNNIGWYWVLELHLYVASVLQNIIAIPFHHCSATLEMSNNIIQTSFNKISLRPLSLHSGIGSQIISTNTPRLQFDSLTINATSSELIIQGPGKFILYANNETEQLDREITDSVVDIHIKLQPVDSENAILIATKMLWSSNEANIGNDVKGEWVVAK